MENKQEKWIEDVFNSMKDSQKAKPDPRLLDKIENQLFSKKVKIVPMISWKKIAVAATIIGILNIYTFHQINQNQLNDNQEIVSEESYDLSLISDYKIYE